MIGRSMMGWIEYQESLAPFAPPPPDGASQWGGRPVVNLLGVDLQLPPVLDAACYDKAERGPAANRGLFVREAFNDATVLGVIARQGEGGERLRGAPTRLRTFSLTEGNREG